MYVGLIPTFVRRVREAVSDRPWFKKEVFEAGLYGKYDSKMVMYKANATSDGNTQRRITRLCDYYQNNTTNKERRRPAP